MDWIVPVAIAANTVLLLGAMIVGGRLLLPTAKRLPNHIDRPLAERQGAAKLPRQLDKLTEELIATRDELAQVSERQQFLEALLEQRQRAHHSMGAFETLSTRHSCNLPVPRAVKAASPTSRLPSSRSGQ